MYRPKNPDMTDAELRAAGFKESEFAAFRWTNEVFNNWEDYDEATHERYYEVCDELGL